MRKVVLRIITIAVLSGALLPLPAAGQGYPAKSVRMILPFPPGGPTDITGRAIAQKLSEQLGQTVVPENRPGAAGNLGLELGAKAAPDGYTVTLTAPQLAVSPSLYAKLNYDAVRDFAPVSLVAATQNIMVVHNSVPAKTVKEFVQLARRNPGKLNFSSSGAGSTNHLATELLKVRFKLDMVHVPFKGSSLALVALMSGEVDMGTMPVPGAIPIVRANKVRPLAVLSERREPALPDVPTMKESGVDDFVVPIWYGVLAPAGTAREIVNRLNSELHKALASTDLIQRLAAAGVQPMTSTPEQFAGFLKTEIVRYAKIIKDAGIKIE